MKKTSRIQSRAWNIECDFKVGKLMSCGDMSFATRISVLFAAGVAWERLFGA